MEQPSESHTPSKSSSQLSLKAKFQRFRAKLFSAYYGHPIRDMKLIAVTGANGKSDVAHFVHEILRASGQHVAVLASDSPIQLHTLHKFFADAWKAGSNYVIVTAPAESLRANVFYDLPVHLAVITDSVAPDLAPETTLAAEASLFAMHPEIVVLNEDDPNFSNFANFSGTAQTLTYGTTRSATVRIDSAKLYKKGTEASLSLGSSRFSVASFLVGEPVVSYMACAAAVAAALNLSTEYIIDGLANYAPNDD